MSALLDILESKYPIIQGPIGEMNDPKMVAAVSEAGGFGMLALKAPDAGADGVVVSGVESGGVCAPPALSRPV
jgi:NAD(P)H-dependent flavin oxidoreductase YrpB (nitropropane dioxygenase family)